MSNQILLIGTFKKNLILDTEDIDVHGITSLIPARATIRPNDSQLSDYNVQLLLFTK